MWMSMSFSSESMDAVRPSAKAVAYFVRAELSPRFALCPVADAANLVDDHSGAGAFADGSARSENPGSRGENDP